MAGRALALSVASIGLPDHRQAGSERKRESNNSGANNNNNGNNRAALIND
jgi:hypothetical protein